ncbi:hypothetical protein M9Y10_019389 [Tritrichomonas musculus]|uniref:RING-type domain-containing protein n=1 Tax=Tritrichomonas musculus TaxID=1915356 RepID=A0ABR2HJD7_9EUKA
MGIDFVTILNESNSDINKETGEILITSPIIESNEILIIKTPCKIYSNCNTHIKCKHLIVESSGVFLENIFFETTLEFVFSDDLQISNCNLEKEQTDKDGAILIKKSKNVQINNLIISKVQNASGIFITEKSSVIADNISIEVTDSSLIKCNEESSLKITNSKFDHSNCNGIFAENSTIEVEKCSFTNMIFPAICAHNCNCSIKNNEIRNIEENGITIVKTKKNSDGSNINFVNIIKNNIFSDIQGSGISIWDESVITIDENSISNIQGNGIYISNHSKVTGSKNEIYDCKHPAIAILLKSDATLENFKISNINYSGICVRDAGKVTIENFEIKNCNDSGISVSDTDECIIKGSSILNCNIAAVEAYNQSKVSVNNCNISEIKEYSFLVYTSAELKAEENNISEIGKAMVRLIHKGGGDFIKNKIFNCPIQNDGQTSSQYFFFQNGEFSSVTNDESRKTDLISFDEVYDDTNLLCFKCHQNPRDYFLLNCGHKVYCQTCAQEALQNHEKCPLCRMPVSNISEGYEITDGICGVCRDEKPKCLVIPCGHIGYCKECMMQWFLERQSCPFCHKEPVTFKNIQHF